MVRRLLSGLRHLLGALVLLTGLVCLLEVFLSARRASMLAEGRAETVEDLAVPSRVAYQELRPLCRTSSAGEPVVETNSFGIRGTEPAAPKPESNYRVLVLGDEATLAAATPERQTFCAIATELLKGRTTRSVEILNGGIPGGCPLTQALRYRHRLSALQPDAVVMLLDAGDVADDLRYRPYVRNDPDGRPLVCVHPTLGGRRGPVDAWRSEFRVVDLGGRYLLDRWVANTPPVRGDMLSKSRRAEWLQAPGGVWSDSLRGMLSPLSSLRSDAAGAEIAAVVVPDGMGPAAGWSEASKILSEIGVRLIDPSGTFAQMGPEAGLFAETPRYGDRLSERGHQRMGFELAAAIAQFPGVR